MKTLIHTLFFFLLITQISFAQWYQQNSGTTKNLNKVQFIDANNGWAVGDSGIIIKTTNAGLFWLRQSSGTNQRLSDVCFRNKNLGWAVGGSVDYWIADSAIILKTTDGGLNWIKQLSINGHFNDVCFTNENIGYAIGYEFDDSSGIHYFLMVRTMDGGNTWTYQYHDHHLSCTDFINDDIGWIIERTGDNGYPHSYISKTTDGGVSWEIQDTLGGGFNKFKCFDSNFCVSVGWMGMRDYGFVAKTFDGGSNWIEEVIHDSDVTILEFSDICISSVDVITIVEHVWFGSHIIRSTDSGNTWSIQTIDPVVVLNGVAFTDDNTGWVVGDNGTILHTTNGGVSFVEEELIDEIPSTYSLSNNFPNPFNPSTKIKYSVPQPSQIIIKVFDILGNEIETLVREEKQAGTYEITWYAANLPSGVYFYKLQAGGFIQTKKMVLLK